MILYFMVKFVLWIFIIYGITQIIVESELFEGFRMRVHRWNPRVGSLVHCMLCTSVWVAFLVSFTLWSPSESVFLTDIVDIPALTDQMEFHATNPFEQIVNIVGVKVTLLVNRAKFMFFDGMFGSALVWFLVLVEKLITSMIGFFNSFKKEKINATVEKQSIQSDGERN